MPRALAILLASAVFILAPLSRVGADVSGVPNDNRAGMCDAFDGFSFTFCVAFCEARECDLHILGDERCAALQHGFARATGGLSPPCMVGTVASMPALSPP
jgi:hypothetical protein